jgi:hypothetical protein
MSFQFIQKLHTIVVRNIDNPWSCTFIKVLFIRYYVTTPANID